MSQAAPNGSAIGPDVPRALRHLGYWWNRHDLQRVVALYAVDYEGVDIGCGSIQRGPEAAGECLAGYWQAFPDLRIGADDTVVQGDRVAVAWRARGTHRGTFMSIPATGRRVTLRGVSLLILDAGKLRRATHVWDVAGFLRAVRLLPDL